MESDTFVNRTFKSSNEFEEAFAKYKDEHFVAFRKKSSETSVKANLKSKAQIPAEFVYSRVEYICTHYGEPKYRGSQIKSRSKHTATGCQAAFLLKYDYYDRVYKITKHHMVHNHPTTASTYSQEYQVKRLTQPQKESLKEIVELNPRNENLMRMVNNKFQKAYTLTEVRYLKHQLSSGRQADVMVDLLNNLEDLQQYGKVKVVVSQNGSNNMLDIVAFSTNHMIDIFAKYPEVIYMDGTYKNNKSGFPLYQIMIEDGSGKGRAVFYAFVRQENGDLLSSMLRIFVNFMGTSTEKTAYAMTDKDPNEINAITQAMPHVSTMLCAFHVHKAMKTKVQKLQCAKEVRDRLQQQAYVLVTTNDIATFNRQLKAIEETSADFFDYLNVNWMPNVASWAYHARLHSRLFFNDTNNKCEGENRRLKEILSSNTNLSLAVRRLFEHSLTQHFEVSTASVVQTTSVQLYRDANPRWTNFYSYFTPYAVQLMIQDHASCPVEVTAVEDRFDCSDASGVVYCVSGRPLTCHCPFFSQTSLPCCHIMSVFSGCIQVTLADLFSESNRWLKSNVIAAVSSAQVAPVEVRQLVGPEARHHRTEALLARLSCLLKLCGSSEFGERIDVVERVVDAWESNKGCVVIVNGDVVSSDVGDVVVGVDGFVGVGDRARSVVEEGNKVEIIDRADFEEQQVDEVVDRTDVEERRVDEVVHRTDVEEQRVDVVDRIDVEEQRVDDIGDTIEVVEEGTIGEICDSIEVEEGGRVNEIGDRMDVEEGRVVIGDISDPVGERRGVDVSIFGERIHVVADIHVHGSDVGGERGVDEIFGLGGRGLNEIDGEGRGVGEMDNRIDVLEEATGEPIEDVEGRAVQVGPLGERIDAVSDIDGRRGVGEIFHAGGTVVDGISVGVSGSGEGVAPIGGVGASDSSDLSLQDLRQLNVKVPIVRKRGRPKQLKTRSYKKAKKVKFSSDLCYVCFQEEVPRELCVDGRMDWVGCHQCPRWFHIVCLDVSLPGDDWVCKFCKQ
ncbi:zinc finger SWIM domain-containing protein 3 [Elysia marginata]|uniref:Zinc finger SWIM domain-containing protein 3 n=1 Tax=Elysia marginata TaxID=1093978 RepID=A0AAV4JNH0_9GAST|nr:zinc finger SWIM domain-containing protein 3 [Elysia marginata]